MILKALHLHSLDCYSSLMHHNLQLGHATAAILKARALNSILPAGIADAYWELRIKPWDVAAGTLLVTEAGGTITTMDGKVCAFALLSK